MDDAGRVLVVETGGAGRGELVRTLTETGYTAMRVDWGQVLATAGESATLPDLVVTPWNLGTDTDGLRLHRTVAERAPGIATLILFRPQDVDRLPDAPPPPGVRLLRDPCDAVQLLSSARGAVAEARALRRP
jgi:DNA-binding NtrC family response regulator